jgi:hypothetical protein
MILPSRSREDYVATPWGCIYVSTLARGGDPARPLYETRCYRAGDPWGGRVWRYSTWEDARQGHRRIVAALRAGTWPPPPAQRPSAWLPLGAVVLVLIALVLTVWYAGLR